MLNQWHSWRVNNVVVVHSYCLLCTVCFPSFYLVQIAVLHSRLFVSHLSKLSPIPMCVCVYVVVYGSCRVLLMLLLPLSCPVLCIVDGQCQQELCALLSVINSIFIHDCTLQASEPVCECHCLRLGLLSVFARYGQQADSSQLVLMLNMSSISTCTQEPEFPFGVLSVSTSLQLELLMAVVMMMMLMMCSCNKWGNLQKSACRRWESLQMLSFLEVALLCGDSVVVVDSLSWLTLPPLLIRLGDATVNEEKRGIADDNEQEQKVRARLASSFIVRALWPGNWILP